ncbi:hypothetical protein [Alteribacter populi]|uniref:hypothetical protein n=1 Tax=Alteribacter populi TaxID=2011011 RepID=UPI000BBA4F28|nr:hypothetical protein [Alteribacter populi]
MKTFKVTELKRELQKLDKKELITIISDLYKANKEVTKSLSVKFGGSKMVDELYQEAKQFFQNEENLKCV